MRRDRVRSLVSGMSDSYLELMLDHNTNERDSAKRAYEELVTIVDVMTEESERRKND